MKTNKRLILDKLYEHWCLWYVRIISIIGTVTVIFVQNRYNIEFWKAKYYSDMLTALITFLSIVISIFGVLIPALISAKEKNSVVEYFFDVADNNLFIKSIKRIISSGLASILFVCGLYLYDIIPRKSYLAIFDLSIFLILYFCCTAYRFLGIMVNLLMKRKKGSNNQNITLGKKYKYKVSDSEREVINKRLTENNSN